MLSCKRVTYLLRNQNWTKYCSEIEILFIMKSTLNVELIGPDKFVCGAGGTCGGTGIHGTDVL